METDNSIASFWHSYRAAEKATQLLTGRAVSLAPDPMADAVHTDKSPDNVLPEVFE